jgi:serine/threonine-protein kinase
LAKNPSRRYPSAKALVQDLRQFLQSARRRPPTPTLAGHQFIKVLGESAISVVYQFQNQVSSDMVALKVIHTQATPQAILAFHKTNEKLVGLQHPNLVNILRVGQLRDRRLCLAREFVDGESLARQLRGKPFSARRAVEVVQSLAEALHAVHERGIHHLNLTPATVLMTTAGTPKIIDFGLADLQVGEEGSLYAVSFLAPEQVLGKLDQINARTDVYALGGILYALLTGRSPFSGQNLLEMATHVESNVPAFPAAVQASVPELLQGICLKCLHKEPAQRYTSALALKEELQRFLQSLAD